jgi:hypothetical protein
MKHHEIKRLINGAGKAEQKDPDPAYLTPPAVSTSAETIINNMTFQALDVICEGPIQGFVDETGEEVYVDDGGFLKAIYLGESAIKNGNGSYNYQRVKVDARLGYSDQTKISMINRPSMEYSMNKTLYGPYVYDATVSAGKLGTSSIDVRPSAARPTTGSGTGNLNFSNWADASIGMIPLDAPREIHTIKDKSCRYFSFTIGVNSLYDTAFVDTKYSAVRDGSIRNPKEEYKAGETYSTIVRFVVEWGRVTVKGVENIAGSSEFTIYGYCQSTSYIDFGLNNYYSNEYKRFYGVDGTNMVTFQFPSGWDEEDTEFKFVRFYRSTPETYSTLIKRKIGVSKVTEYSPVFLKYPLCALGAIKGDARIFSEVPKRNYKVRLMQVFTPNNYQPLIDNKKVTGYVTNSNGSYSLDSSGNKIPIYEHHITDRRRYKTSADKPSNKAKLTVYDGTWDYKTLVKQWTDNPVWIALDILTSPRYGLGAYISMEDIDMFSFYDAARYCDNVDDDGLFIGASNGYGGLEPLYHCSVHIKERMNTLEVLNSVLSLFDGSLYWESGKIAITYTAAASRVRAMFNNRNVIDGVFSYTSSKRDSQYNVVEVTYQDETDLYKNAIEYCTNEESLRDNGPIKTAMTAWGCTSKGMARRIGDRYLKTTNRDIQSVTFSTGYEALLLQLNDIIIIDDDLMNLTDNYGRLIDAYQEVVQKVVETEDGEEETVEEETDSYILVVDVVVEADRVDETTSITVYRANPNITKATAASFSPDTVYSYDVTSWTIDEEAGTTTLKIPREQVGKDDGGFMIGSVVSIQTKDYASQIYRVAIITDKGNGAYDVTGTFVSREEYIEIAESLATHYARIAQLNGLPVISNNTSIYNPDFEDEVDYSQSREEAINKEYDEMMGILLAPDDLAADGFIDDSNLVEGVYMGTIDLSWTVVDNASAYRIKIKNSSNQVIYDFTVDDIVATGEYEAQQQASAQKSRARRAVAKASNPSMTYTVEAESDLYSISIWTINNGGLASRYPTTIEYYLVDEGMKYRTPTITDISIEGS